MTSSGSAGSISPGRQLDPIVCSEPYAAINCSGEEIRSLASRSNMTGSASHPSALPRTSSRKTAHELLELALAGMPRPSTQVHATAKIHTALSTGISRAGVGRRPGHRSWWAVDSASGYIRCTAIAASCSPGMTAKKRGRRTTSCQRHHSAAALPPCASRRVEASHPCRRPSRLEQQAGGRNLPPTGSTQNRTSAPSISVSERLAS